VTFIEAAFFLPCFLVAIVFLWLLAYVPQHLPVGRTLTDSSNASSRTPTTKSCPVP
jgi:hypothetical protein